MSDTIFVISDLETPIFDTLFELIKASQLCSRKIWILGQKIRAGSKNLIRFSKLATHDKTPISILFSICFHLKIQNRWDIPAPVRKRGNIFTHKKTRHYQIKVLPCRTSIWLLVRLQYCDVTTTECSTRIWFRWQQYFQKNVAFRVKRVSFVS